MKELRIFDDGINKYYTKDFSDAKESFLKLTPQYNQDGVIQYYLNRIDTYLEVGLSDDWNSFEVFDY
jgi:hypothetical protein